MFLVDAAILLPHTPHAVARVVDHLHLLPRWCRGLRRVRASPAVTPREGAESPREATCLFSYAVLDRRLVLRARTLTRDDAPAFDPAPSGGSSHGLPSQAAFSVTHTADGDGLTLTWTLTATPCDAPSYAHAEPVVRTELRARVQVHVDAAQALAADRASLCRVVARRVPADLERLRVLLARYDASQAAPSTAPVSPDHHERAEPRVTPTPDRPTSNG